MLSKAAKNDIVKEFSEVFKANPSVLLVEYKGLTVAELEGIRTNLKEADTRFKVVKNTLLKKAAKDTDIEQINDLMAGPTAIAVCENDPTAAAKVFVKTAKDLPSLVIKGGLVEGNVVSADEIEAISKLPSRQEMMAQLLGALSSPMSNLLGSLTQMQSKLLYALEAVKDTKEEGGAEAEEAKEEAPVEAKKEAEPETSESKEAAASETKEETSEAAEVEAKAEDKTEIKEEDGAESAEETEVEGKEES